MEAGWSFKKFLLRERLGVEGTNLEDRNISTNQRSAEHSQQAFPSDAEMGTERMLEKQLQPVCGSSTTTCLMAQRAGPSHREESGLRPACKC